MMHPPALVASLLICALQASASDPSIYVAIRPPGAPNREPGYAWRGSGKVFGDRLEWRMAGRVPDAAVLRIWRAAPEDDVEVQELIVFKITPSKFCCLASVDALRPDANNLVPAEAARASERRCGTNSEWRPPHQLRESTN
ncbi:hypothetical protein [Bradyrhizobium sp. S3.5.5]|uniref:hypothetical protein n=1 Tax=Bradyrhizobium sp. S3.5.5 TaxID=3156430 RepID=UPI00339996D0